jgi:hypothetical protein
MLHGARLALMSLFPPSGSPPGHSTTACVDLERTAKLSTPPDPEAGTSWASMPAHENGGADAGAPVLFVADPQPSAQTSLSAASVAAAVDAARQARPPLVLAPTRAALDAPAAPGVLSLYLGRAGLRDTKDPQRADAKGAEPPQNPSPRGRGCHPLRDIVEPSPVHVEPPEAFLPHRLPAAQPGATNFRSSRNVPSRVRHSLPPPPWRPAGRRGSSCLRWTHRNRNSVPVKHWCCNAP